MSILFFEDRVVRMSHTVERGKVHVAFAREPAMFWVKPASVGLLELLADAVESGRPVSVAGESDSMEIVSVKQVLRAAQ